MDEISLSIFDDIHTMKKTIIASTICRFDIPDIICESHDPLTAQEIVDRLSKRKSPQLDSLFGDKPHVLDVEYLERVLRAAAASGLLTETNERKFGKTSRLEVLTSTHPVGMKYYLQAMITEKATYFCWGYIGEVIMDRNFNPMKESFGVDSLFEYYNQDRFEFENFHRAMLHTSKVIINKLVQVYDFNKFHTVVDVGGSNGFLIKNILHSFPKVRKGINFDLEKVVIEMRSKENYNEGLGNRYELVGGDFFKAVCPGDCYVLKHILHDWADEDCIKILSNIVKAMHDGVKVLIIEHVINEFGNTDQFYGKWLDVEMMLLSNAKERRRDQFEELFRRVGLKAERYIPLDPLCIIELGKIKKANL